MNISVESDALFDPNQRADFVTKAILQRQFAILLTNLDGVRALQNPEFLHDFRVAIRRSRSALTQIKGVFPNGTVELQRSRLTWLQQVTNPLRDLDVYLSHFDADCQRLPVSLQPALKPLHDYLLRIHQHEQQQLITALDSNRFAEWIQDWRSFLETPVPEKSSLVNAMRPIKRIANQRIWRLNKRVRCAGRAIQIDTADEERHALRKDCKKLRYLMEFFQHFYPEQDIRRLIKQLKTLLDYLGDYQDIAVQVRYLSDFAQQMRNENLANTATLLAMGALIGVLLEQQQTMRYAFDVVFADYLNDDHQALFRTLFAATH